MKNNDHPDPHPLDLAPMVDNRADFSTFNELVESLKHWIHSAPQWPPAQRITGQWEQVELRLDRARLELSRVLVVGVIGGTGTGKSTLVNALAGCNISPAGDVARPTTIHPVIVVARDVDLSWLPVDAMQARVVHSDSAAIANIVLIDCPDPDTQADCVDQPAGGSPADRSQTQPTESNHNRDLLEKVLPVCDVLLLVATAQKYRSWIVAREVAMFAPGRPLLFVQTHASRDPDIREDWRRELQSQGFVVPHIFRVDALQAAQRAAALLEPEPEFKELVTAIDAELVGRAARRVRRTGALDLTGWFLLQSRGQFAELGDAVAQLAAGVQVQRARLEALAARAIEAKLRSSRSSWQGVLTEEVIDRWHGGLFPLFLHALAAIGSFWPRMRSVGGSLIGRILSGQAVAPVATGHAAWAAIEELGINEAEVEQSRSILIGQAARARIFEPLVGRARLDASSVQITVGTLLERSGAWLATGIKRLVNERRGRIDSALVRGAFEVLFSGLVVAVLGRAAWNFFIGHLWFGRSLDGAGFLLEAFVWLILWGLLLRWLVLVRVRTGLDRDIRALVDRLPSARLIDPLLSDFAEAAAATSEFVKQRDSLDRDWTALAKELAEPSSELGRLHREPS